MQVLEFEPMTAGDMSQSTLIAGPLNVEATTLIGAQAAWTGSPVGTIKVQVSNDNVTYSDYTGSETAVSGAGNFAWNISDYAFRWIRVFYTKASGTGSLAVSFEGKD